MKYLKLVIPRTAAIRSIGRLELGVFARLETTVKGQVGRRGNGGQSCLTAVIMAFVCEAMSDLYAISANTKVTVKNFNKKCLQVVSEYKAAEVKTNLSESPWSLAILTEHISVNVFTFHQ